MIKKFTAVLFCIVFIMSSVFIPAGAEDYTKLNPLFYTSGYKKVYSDVTEQGTITVLDGDASILSPSYNADDKEFIIEIGAGDVKNGYCVFTVSYTKTSGIGIEETLKIICTGADNYIVFYDANGGSGAPENQSGEEIINIPDTKPTFEGKVFAGWAATPDAEDEAYRPGDKMRPSYSMPTVLYAVYKDIVPFTVIFDSNGGTADTKTKDCVNYVEIGELPGAAKAGYSFDGWYTEAAGGTKVNEDDSFGGVTDNLTLYAHYTANKYNVSFVTESEDVFDSKEVTFDSPYGELPVPAKALSSFTGWYKDGEKINADSVVSTLGDHTLTAGYEQSRFLGIKNMPANKTNTFDYKSTITFNAEIKDSNGKSVSSLPGNGYTWYVDGIPANTNGSKITVSKAKSDFTLKVVYQAGDEIIESETETVIIKHNFFNKIVSFFKGLFGKLNITQ